MKAAAIRQFGDVDAIEILDLPDPAAAPGEVVLDVRAASLNHIDIWVRKGARPDVPLPHILGTDLAGTVAALGEGVTGLEVGREVVVMPALRCGRCEFCRRGEQNLCSAFGIVGLSREGSFAEKIAVPAANVFAKPANLDFIEAAALPVAYVTAWRMMMTRAAVRPGETVLIHGVGGGVALACLQFATLIGARAIVTSSSNDKLEKAARLGAAHTVNYRETGDLAAAVLDLTDGRGVDAIMDSVGAATWPVNFKAIRRGGRIVHCGITTGAKAPANIQALYWNQFTVMGSTAGSDEDFREMLQVFATGRLKPIIDSVKPLANIRAATRRMEDGQQFGKIVLEVAG